MASNIILLKSNGETSGYTNIQSAIDSGSSGDCVVIYNNTYNENINLKNGVNLYTLPGTIISGTEIAGTLRDNGNQVNIYFDGRAEIYNSNGNQYNMVLSNIYSTVKRYNYFSDGITGSLYGTASYAQNAISYWTSSNGTITRNSDVNITGSLNIETALTVGDVYITNNSMSIVSSLYTSEPEINLKLIDNPYDYGWKFRVVNPGPTSSFSLNILNDTGLTDRSALTILNSTNYVGIRNRNPQSELDVSGSLIISGSISIVSTGSAINYIKNYYTTTTNTTPVSISLDFSNLYVHNYSLDISAYSQTNNELAAYKITGLFYKSGSLNISNEFNILQIASSTNFTGSVSSSIYSGSLMIHLTGGNSTITRWGMTLNTTGVYTK